MESAAFWRDLRREFQELSASVDRSHDLHAIDNDDGTWVVGGGPADKIERAALLRRFRVLAERGAAGAAFSVAGGLQDSWLTLLKSGPRYVPIEMTRMGDGSARSSGSGWIDRVLIASADFCAELETHVFHSSSIAPLQQRKVTAREGQTQPTTSGASLIERRPEGERRPATWEKVQVSFLSDERVQITVLDKTYTQNYSEMGFSDGRSERPIKAWYFLRALAERDGDICVAPENTDWGRVEKRVQEIRKILRAHFINQGFDIPPESNPLPFLRGGRSGYRSLFKLTRSRSYDT